MSELKSALLGNLTRRELESYLEHTGGLATPSLGPDEEEGGHRAVDTGSLARSVGEAQGVHRRIFSLSVGILVALFGLQVAVVVHGLAGGDNVAWALSGTLMIWPAFWWVRRLWLDRVLLEQVHHLLRELPPEQAVEVLKIIYWGPLRPKR